MMVFSTLGSVRQFNVKRRCFCLWLTQCLLLVCWGLFTPTAYAVDAIEVVSARIERSIDGEAWMLNSDIDINLGARLEDAVNKGLPLYFVLEVELTKSRWYWFDEKTVSRSQTYRLTYHALTRQYRVAIGAFQQTFSTLQEAIDSMSRVRGWRVVDVDQLSNATRYDAQVRMRLDSSQLPKPFQVIGITNRDWQLSTEWKKFSFISKLAP